jgi:ribonuclease HII
MRNRMLGKKLSDETKKKIGDASRGKNISQETKDKISKTMTGKKRAPMKKEIKDKCIQNLIYTKNKKTVGKYDINNNLIEIYSSITEASIKNNIERMIISNICNNKIAYKSVHNYIFKFIS